MQGSRIAALGAIAAGIVAAALPSTGAAAPACTPSLSPAAEARLSTLINASAARCRCPPSPAARSCVARDVSRVSRWPAAAPSRTPKSLRWAAGHAGGQNIAMAPSAAIAFRAMLKSPPHRRNMLASAWRFGGIGAARGCNGQIFFTVNFLAP